MSNAMYVHIHSEAEGEGSGGKTMRANFPLKKPEVKRDAAEHLDNPEWHVQIDGTTYQNHSHGRRIRRRIEIELTPKDISELLRLLAKNRLLKVSAASQECRR